MAKTVMFTMVDDDEDRVDLETNSHGMGLLTVTAYPREVTASGKFVSQITVKSYWWQLLYDWIATNCPVEKRIPPMEDKSM